MRSRYEREVAAKEMVKLGKQPNEIAQVTGCSLMWIEQLVAKAGGRPMQFEVET